MSHTKKELPVIRAYDLSSKVYISRFALACFEGDYNRAAVYDYVRYFSMLPSSVERYDGFIDFSTAHIAHSLMLQCRTVNRHLAFLIENGWLEEARGDDGKFRKFRVSLTKMNEAWIELSNPSENIRDRVEDNLSCTSNEVKSQDKLSRGQDKLSSTCYLQDKLSSTCDAIRNKENNKDSKEYIPSSAPSGDGPLVTQARPWVDLGFLETADVSEEESPITSPPADNIPEKTIPNTKTRVKNFVRHWAYFWALYPRKVSREESAKSWTKKVSTVEEAMACIEGAKRLKTALATGEIAEARHIPHPTTFLNQQRFLDFIGEDEDVPVEIVPTFDPELDAEMGRYFEALEEEKRRDEEHRKLIGDAFAKIDPNHAENFEDML